MESLNRSLHELFAEDERVFLIGEDLHDPYGGAFKVSKGLSTAYPERVLGTPISEPGITGFAAGMAMNELRPIVEIMFGDFLTLCTDQIVNGITKFEWMYNSRVKVPLVIRTPMGGRRGYGPTHSQTLETLFLNVPGLTIVAPSHLHDPGRLLRAAVLEHDAPVLFIENKLLYPSTLHDPTTGRVQDFFATLESASDPRYPTWRLKLAREAEPQLTIVAYGGMAPLALEAAHEIFMEDEIVAEVVVPSLVKPLPVEDLVPSFEASRCGILVEEAVGAAGWSAMTASALYRILFNRLEKALITLGAVEAPIPSSRPLEDTVLVQKEEIIRAAQRLVGGA